MTLRASRSCCAATSASATFVRSIARARARRRAVELLADVRADAGAELVELVRLLDPVVEDDELRERALDERACGGSSRRAARAAGSGRRCRAGCPRRRSRARAPAGFASSVEERADEAPPEVGERQALRLGVALVLPGGGDHEVDERVVRVPAVDRERRDARADDDREGEERARRRSRRGPGSCRSPRRCARTTRRCARRRARRRVPWPSSGSESHDRTRCHLHERCHATPDARGSARPSRRHPRAQCRHDRLDAAALAAASGRAATGSAGACPGGRARSRT